MISAALMQAVRNGGATPVATQGGGGGGGGLTDTDAIAYIGAMSVAPSSPIQTAIQTFIVNAKSDGSWALIRQLAIPGYGVSQSGMLNMKTATTGFTPTNMVFTANRGAVNSPRSNASSSGMIAVEALNAGSFAAQDDHSVFAYINTFAFQNFGGIWVPVNGTASKGVYLGQAGTGQQFDLRAADGDPFSGDYVNTDPLTYKGLWIGERSGTTSTRLYKPDGSSVTGTATSTNSFNTVVLNFGGSDGGANMDSPSATTQYAAIGWGKSMGTTVAASFRSNLITLLTAIGCN